MLHTDLIDACRLEDAVGVAAHHDQVPPPSSSSSGTAEDGASPGTPPTSSSPAASPARPAGARVTVTRVEEQAPETKAEADVDVIAASLASASL